jgi:hypothetical protein
MDPAGSGFCGQWKKIPKVLPPQNYLSEIFVNPQHWSLLKIKMT